MDNSSNENLDKVESDSGLNVENTQDCMEHSHIDNNSQIPTVSTENSTILVCENNTIDNQIKDVCNETKTNCNKQTSTDNRQGSLNSSKSLMNSSLFALSVYGDSASSEEEDCIDDECQIIPRNSPANKGFDESEDAFSKSQTNYLNVDDDVSSVSSLSSNNSSLLSEESDFSDDDDDFDIELAVKPEKKQKPINKTVTKGELTLDDLPPIEDLFISVPQDKCVLLGTILNIVDKLVVVQGIKDLPALDLDTVLFLEWNKPLGNVFDVFGPVIEPLYCVRFNSNDHVKDKGISPGMPVYFVPESNHTKYVFLKQLIRIKGSDASWEDNNEPPPQFLDFSDDEEERKALKAFKREKKEIKRDPDAPERKRPTFNDQDENKRNFHKGKPRRSQQRKNEDTKMQNNNNVIHSPVFVPPPFSYATSSPQHSSNDTSFSRLSSFPLNSTNIAGPSLSVNPFDQNRYNLPNPLIFQNHSSSNFPQQQVNHTFGMHSTLSQQINTTTGISNTMPAIGNMSIPPPLLFPNQLTNPSNSNQFSSPQINPRTFSTPPPPIPAAPPRFSFGSVTPSFSFPFPPPIANRPQIPFPAVVTSNNTHVPVPLVPSSLTGNGSIMQTFPNNFQPPSY